MSRDIARELAFATLRGETGTTGGKNFSGDEQKPLDIWAHEAMARALRRSHACSAYISEEAPEPIEMPEGTGPRAVVVACDPVDGSSNLDVGGSVGTIFSIRAAGGRAPAAPGRARIGGQSARRRLRPLRPRHPPRLHDGRGHARLHARSRRRRVRPHASRHPGAASKGKTYGINEGNAPTGIPASAPSSSTCARPDKGSGRPYSLRYSGAMVADVHRTLLDGGIFMYPADMTDPAKPKPKLRLLYEVAPMAFVAEQARRAGEHGHGAGARPRRQGISPARGDPDRQRGRRGARRGLLPEVMRVSPDRRR